ncbi:hypothetical protein Xkoz_01702 [Xenorhabdus kozodoii]|uniref:Uncharacterized protein n=2 Tax=Xenorhabdus kozodoii TaxID=351676 RepID=A0A2D0LD19_9GAMM|nr:hypothetical protein Xkoz_01702 [Xenorhabdus kozodoii]
MNISYQYYDYVDYHQPSNLIVLKGKTTSSIPEHYYLSKDKNGNIKVMLYINNKKPAMPKNLLVIKNPYIRKWVHSIYTLSKK